MNTDEMIRQVADWEGMAKHYLDDAAGAPAHVAGALMTAFREGVRTGMTMTMLLLESNARFWEDKVKGEADEGMRAAYAHFAEVYRSTKGTVEQQLPSTTEMGDE